MRKDSFLGQKYVVRVLCRAASIYFYKFYKSIHLSSCCGAGTAADTEMTTNMISSQLELHRLNTGRVVPVTTANTLLKQMLFRYQGHVSAALILGGVDNNGPHVYCIYPHGSTDTLPYATMGSGSLAAMSVFECNSRINVLHNFTQ